MSISGGAGSRTLIDSPRRRRLGLKRQTGFLGLLLVAPVVVYLLIAMAYPFASAVSTSLTDKRIGVPGQFIGLNNYVELGKTPLFWLATRNTIVFTALALVFKLAFGMVMALVLNQKMILQNLWRALLFLPWTIPTIVTVLTFQWMFSSTGGVFNYFLLQSNLIQRPIDWLGTPVNAMISVVLVNVWRGTPFFGISLLGGLQSIPGEQYEAAQIDGANVWQRFCSITLPAIRNVTLLVTVVSTIWTLNDFQIIWVLTRGGPANTTQVYATLTYVTAFLNLDLGLAIAVSLAAVPFLIVLVWWATRYVLRRD